MRYIDIKVNSSALELKKELEFNSPPITSGSVNDIACRFEFSDDWNDMDSIMVIFVGSNGKCSLSLTNNTIIIPSECISVPDNELFVGLIGLCPYDDSEEYRQITTEMLSLGIITQGASPYN